MVRASVLFTVAFAWLAACGGQTASSGGGPQSHADAGADAATGDAATGDAATASGDGATANDAADETSVTPTFFAVLQGSGCLPQAFLDGANGIPCTVFAVLPAPSGGSPSGACNEAMGLAPVDATLTAKLQTIAQASATAPVCAVRQLTTGADPGDFQGGSCRSSADPGWCYVTGGAAGECPQAIAFSSGMPPPGSVAVLGCE